MLRHRWMSWNNKRPRISNNYYKSYSSRALNCSITLVYSRVRNVIFRDRWEGDRETRRRELLTWNKKTIRVAFYDSWPGQGFSTFFNIFYWNILKINTLNMPKVKSSILGELVLSFVANKKRVTVLRDRLWALITWAQNNEMTSNFFMLVISIVSKTYFEIIIIRCLFLVLVLRWRHMKTKNWLWINGHAFLLSLVKNIIFYAMIYIQK